MSDSPDHLKDPLVVRALRRLGAADAAALCPRCGHREVAGDADWCDPCTRADAADRRASKRSWWARQGDYRELRIDHGPREAAARWIAHRLRKGPVTSSEMAAAAASEGIPTKTLRRAREKLQRPRRGEAVGRLVVERGGLPRGASQWRLTTRDERRPDAQVGTRSSDRRAGSARQSQGLVEPDTADDDQEHTR